MASKGASSLDKCAHRVFVFAADKRVSGWWGIVGASCRRCGGELETSYCEERLYLVRCRHCETVTLVKGASPKEAAELMAGEGERDE